MIEGINDTLVERLSSEGGADAKELLSWLKYKASESKTFKPEYKKSEFTFGTLWIVNCSRQLNLVVRYQGQRFFVVYGTGSQNIYVTATGAVYEHLTSDSFDAKKLFEWLAFARGSKPAVSKSFIGYNGRADIIYDNNSYKILAEGR